MPDIDDIGPRTDKVYMYTLPKLSGYERLCPHKTDKGGHDMLEADEVADLVVGRVILLDKWLDHTKQCYTCMMFDETCRMGLYRLGCGEGWLIRHRIAETSTKIANPTLFI